MEEVKEVSTTEQLKQIVDYADLLKSRLTDLESTLHILADAVITSQEVAEQMMLLANTALFDNCV